MAFDVIRTFNHKPFKMRAHLQRLCASLRLLEINCNLSLEELEQITQQTFDRNRTTEPDDVDWLIMAEISRGLLDYYQAAFPQGNRPTIVVACWPLLSHTGSFSENYHTGVNLTTPSQQAMPAYLMDAKTKTRSRIHYKMADLQAKRMGGNYWPLMLDPDGFLAEGPGWNVFLARNGELYTPEPRNILVGISRGVTIQLANKVGIPVHEKNLGRYEALQADELFITSTSYCLAHAATFEGQTVGDGKAGPICRRLTEEWKKYVGLDFIAQAEDYSRRLPQWEKKEREKH